MLVLLNLYDAENDGSYQDFCQRHDIAVPKLDTHFQNCNRCQQGWLLFYSVNRYICGWTDSYIFEVYNRKILGHRHQTFKRNVRRVHQWYIRHVKNRHIPRSLFGYYSTIYRKACKYKLTRKDISKKYRSLPSASVTELKQRYESFKQRAPPHESFVIQRYCDRYALMERNV